MSALSILKSKRQGMKESGMEESPIYQALKEKVELMDKEVLK